MPYFFSTKGCHFMCKYIKSLRINIASQETKQVISLSTVILTAIVGINTIEHGIYVNFIHFQSRPHNKTYMRLITL